jgi:hypothetical protein
MFPRNISVLVGLLSLIVFSCTREKYNVNDFSFDNYNPSVMAPLVNTEFKLHDLISSTLENEDSPISIDEDSLLWVRYSASLLRMQIGDFFTLPEQSISESFSLEPFDMDDISQGMSVSLGDVADNFSEPERSNIILADGNSAPFPAISNQSGGNHPLGGFSQFNSVDFSEGTLAITVTNNWPVDITNVQIEIRNSDNSLLGTFTYPLIVAGTSETESVDLSGRTMLSNVSVNIVSVSSPGSGGIMNPVPIDLDDDLAVDVNISGIKISGGTAVFPSQEVVNESMELDLSQGNGEALTTLRLSAGTITYDISSGIKEDIELDFTLPYATNGGVPFSQTINLNSDNATDTEQQGSFDLSGYELDLTAGGTGTNVLAADIVARIVSSGVPVPFSLSDGVSFELSFGDITIDYLEGNIGTQTFDLPEDTIALGMDTLLPDVAIIIADPRISLTLTNSFGIPLGIDFSDITALKDGSDLSLTGLSDPFTIGAPSTNGDSVQTEININNSTTNISDLLSFKPAQLVFGLSGSTNPNGPTTNFLSGESGVAISLAVDIPVYLGVSGFEYRDTLDFPEEVFDNVVEATMKTIITNELPVDINVQAYFLDENYEVIDSLYDEYTPIVTSSEIDGNGEVVSSSVADTDTELNEEKTARLKPARHIVTSTRFSTANNGLTAAKFYSSMKVGIKLGVIAKVRVNLQQNEEE